jgi:hypothetical protein
MPGVTALIAGFALTAIAVGVTRAATQLADKTGPPGWSGRHGGSRRAAGEVS